MEGFLTLTLDRCFVYKLCLLKWKGNGLGFNSVSNSATSFLIPVPSSKSWSLSLGFGVWFYFQHHRQQSFPAHVQSISA